MTGVTHAMLPVAVNGGIDRFGPLRETALSCNEN